MFLFSNPIHLIKGTLPQISAESEFSQISGIPIRQRSEAICLGSLRAPDQCKAKWPEIIDVEDAGSILQAVSDDHPVLYWMIDINCQLSLHQTLPYQRPESRRTQISGDWSIGTILE